MSTSIFISCVYEDSRWINNIKKWCDNELLGNVVITHETEDKRIMGKQAIKEHISKKIRGAAWILILIGNDTHNHDWIEAEVELANSFHKKIICVRLPDTVGSLPKILGKYKLIPFHPNSIKKIINP